jgi:hypothetical protein
MEFHQRWYELVEEYSARTLSRHTDKMMAIAGLAEFIQQGSVIGRAFYAGIWSDVIPFNLLWKRVDGTVAPERPVRAVPSWTWAAVDGKVSHTLATAGPQQSMASQKPAQTSTGFQSPWRDVKLHIRVMDIEALEEHDGLVHHAALKISCHLWSYQDDDLDFSLDIMLDMKAGDLFTLPLVSFVNSEVASTASSPSLHGLLLRKSSVKDRFERVGCFWTTEERYARPIRPILMTLSISKVWLV